MLCSLLVLVSSVTASYVPDINHAKRQDSKTATDATDSTQPTKTTKTADSTDTTTAASSGTDTAATSGTNTDAKSGTGTKGTGTKTTNPKTTTVDPRLPPGGIKLVTPAITAERTYIKIGDFATFAWNYTSVQVTPTAIDVVAFCSKNQHAYTIAGNQSVQETGVVTWDTSKYKSEDVPLLTEIYTLLVYDVEIGPSDIPPAGRLGAQQNFRFGVYSPQPYTPLSGSLSLISIR
ncbi:hypothetical protein PRK78_005261 [Emydomyces testavorans]|uniref:DUF7137 domain-containing protein n=1 Tax=Emydomyces testavorans TaxID=2070801 RepID=A0AAF0DLQ6_9EURO|nr:hypothetical protein PRK78_005261 [Emydomyces testavorans]